ncbi:DUF1800 domain-containing protein [Inhella gelatinilytica]|uniref:DUF1800 family protein n=1 Tax=Inhella gelatinilytica TaxID=2795030 RepID=A0A931IWR9_9BURK|nr:DUF1800 family protein [Inhella gelatinilytica]MBH9552058.1 DUF1800 family protein [Inhella gelatinilytica]
MKQCNIQVVGKGVARLLTGLVMVGMLAGCGTETPEATSPVPPAAPSAGQVGAAKTYKVSFYAASRFAEQASFGPTPALVEELRTKGFEQWIDEQFALAPTLMDPAPIQIYRNFMVTPLTDWEFSYPAREVQRLYIGAPDQLRLRVSWAISQWVVIGRKSDVQSRPFWFNLLQTHALGQYGPLLRAVSVDPGMAYFLDNNQNRPKSTECPWCAPNENYARELMQLFSLGVQQLNLDGTPKRDHRGRILETYTQTDVEEMARVLTGWIHNQDYTGVQKEYNWGNWAKPMVPSTWPLDRDSGQKKVLGRTFPAGQSHDKDLDDAIALLMGHSNTAPFVALRLIQHLVMSDPSPDYVRRVATVFQDNGKGVAGDMKATVKAVLLDPEARRADDPTLVSRAGKFREPMLWFVGAWRGLGCTKNILSNGQYLWTPQAFAEAPNVFSYYLPTDRAPGSNLLAPEQRLAVPAEMRERLGRLDWWLAGPNGSGPTEKNLSDAGCEIQLFTQSFQTSPQAFADLLSNRFFRGAMPPTLRANLAQRMKGNPTWNVNFPASGAMVLTSFALTTPYYGVQK